MECSEKMRFESIDRPVTKIYGFFEKEEDQCQTKRRDQIQIGRVERGHYTEDIEIEFQNFFGNLNDSPHCNITTSTPFGACL